MNIRSCKAKGRRACEAVRDLLLAHFPSLQPDDIRVCPSSVPGEDLQLSPRARELIPFAFEVKNQERLQIYSALDQAANHAQKHAGKKIAPLLVFTRNRSEKYAALRLSDLLSLIQSERNPSNENRQLGHDTTDANGTQGKAGSG